MGGRATTVRRRETTVSCIITSCISEESLRLNEPRAVGNAINTAGVRGSPVSTMNVSTTDTVSSVYSSNITTPTVVLGDRLLIQSHKPTLSQVILFLFHRRENSVEKTS